MQEESNRREWLFTDEQWKLFTSDYEWDWSFIKLWDNGIICPSDAILQIHSTRFQYTEEDCPKCGISSNRKIYKLNHNIYKCSNCLSKFSMTSGTYMEGCKLEYYEIWRFAYLIGDMGFKNSCQIAKNVGVTQLTAWRFIELLRCARKEIEKKKGKLFKTGQEVLSFNNRYEVLDILFSIKT